MPRNNPFLFRSDSRNRSMKDLRFLEPKYTALQRGFRRFSAENTAGYGILPGACPWENKLNKIEAWQRPCFFVFGADISWTLHIIVYYAQNVEG